MTKNTEKLLQEQSKADDKDDEKVRGRLKQQRKKIQREVNLVTREKRRRGLLPLLVPAIGGGRDAGGDRGESKIF